MTGDERDLEALTRFLEARAAIPHAWGRRANDCVSFLFGAVEAQTGDSRDLGLDWEGEAQAIRLLDGIGGMERLLDDRFRRVAPAAAMRGDIGAFEHPVFGLHPAIVEGAMMAAPGPRGLVRLKRARMVAAWSATLPGCGNG